MDSIVLIVLAFAVMYFMMIRPEQKRKKAAEMMQNSLKKGDRITTIGGMVGRVVMTSEKTVVFETSEDRVRIEISKWGIQSCESAQQAAAAKKDAAPEIEESADTSSEESTEEGSAES